MKVFSPKPLLPDTTLSLYAAREGHLHVAVWQHPRTHVHGLSCVGHLYDTTWDDESDALRVFDRALSFLEKLNPSMLVWDFSKFKSISCLGLAHLEGCHYQLLRAGYDAAMVVNPELTPEIACTRMLTRCQQESAVCEAIMILYLNRHQAA
jgi:hypothetical protein